MNPEDKIKELIGKSDITIDAQTENRILGDALKHLDILKQRKSPQIGLYIWRMIMKSTITKSAATAVIIIACVIGLSLWRNTGSGVALADALARVEQVKSFSCKGSFTMNSQIAPSKPSEFETRFTIVLSQEYGYKSKAETQDPNGEWMPVDEIYVSPQKKTFIQIKHTSKKYVRGGLADAEAQQYQKEFSHYGNPGALLKEIMACKYKNLGRSIVDGFDVEGFRTTDPNCDLPLGWSAFKNAQIDVKVWIDVKRRFPVRFEYLISSLNRGGNMLSQRFVVHDFEWDIPVTAMEFESPPVPDGYTVLDNLTETEDEEAAIRGLKQCIELFGDYIDTVSDDAGAFGALVSALEKSETPAALRLKEEIKELTGEETLKRVSDAGKPVLQLMRFYAGLVRQKKEPAYYGKTVTPKDTDKVLLRWKLSDGEYRVIYGDLHAATVATEKLSELEKAAQK
jgi:hypothetical protein